jgi:hypothetical protein
MVPFSYQQRSAPKKNSKTKFSPPSATSKILSVAFITASGSKKSKSPSDADDKVTDFDKIYVMSFSNRQLLAKGSIISLVDADSNSIIDMPLALFRATSSKRDELLPKGAASIKLPRGIDSDIAKALIQHLKEVTTTTLYAKDIQSYELTYEDMQLCSADDALGMGLYTQHIFNWYWARLNAGHLPGYGDISAFSAVETPTCDRIFRKVVNALAKLDFDGQIPDPEDFESYLATEERVRTAVTEAKDKMQRHADYMARRVGQEQEEARQAAVNLTRAHDQAVLEEEKAAKDQAKWDARKKKDTALRETVLKKRAAGARKWTGEEAA